MARPSSRRRAFRAAGRERRGPARPAHTASRSRGAFVPRVGVPASAGLTTSVGVPTSTGAYAAPPEGGTPTRTKSLVQELTPPQQVRHHGAPRPDGVLRVVGQRSPL